MRLLWWHDALAALDDPAKPIPDEPLLAAAAELLVQRGLEGQHVAAIEEGWSILLDTPVPGEMEMATHARARGGNLFEAAARLIGAQADDIRCAGEAWAWADLGHRLSDLDARRTARLRAREALAKVDLRRWPAPLRPLGLLVTLARLDAAMPADQLRRQGAPKRMFRALAYRLTGR